MYYDDPSHTKIVPIQFAPAQTTVKVHQAENGYTERTIHSSDQYTDDATSPEIHKEESERGRAKRAWWLGYVACGGCLSLIKHQHENENKNDESSTIPYIAMPSLYVVVCRLCLWSICRCCFLGGWISTAGCSGWVLVFCGISFSVKHVQAMFDVWSGSLMSSSFGRG